MAAVLNKYYNFSQKYSLIFLNWYVGEVSTAVFVANVPLCWPLVRKVFRLDSWGSTPASARRTGMQSPPVQRTTFVLTKPPAILGPITVVSTFDISHDAGARMNGRVVAEPDADEDEITTLPERVNVERRVEIELGLKRGSICAVHSPFSKFPNPSRSPHWASPRRDLPARHWLIHP